MRVWIASGIALLFVAAACSDSAEEIGNTATATVTSASTPIRTIPTLAPTASPTPSAPATCGFGSGIWEQCAKTAIDPAFDDYSMRFILPSPNEFAIVRGERVEWPDSCLGVSQPDSTCTQVITPGFLFVITAAPGSPYAEYHTDLAGHWVFDTWYALYSGGPSYSPKP